MNNKKFINYSFYSAFLILVAGIIMFIYKHTIFNFLIIILGLTSINNHYSNIYNPEYNINEWPFYRVLDWIFVIFFICFLFINNYKNYNLYIFSLIIILYFTIIIWKNFLKFDNQTLNLCHCFSHIFFIVFLFYIFSLEITDNSI